MHEYEFVNVVKLAREWQDHKLAGRILFLCFDREIRLRACNSFRIEKNKLFHSIELDFDHLIQ